MRYAIIADIHSNLVAFQAVLDDIEQQGGADQLWCLGDIVGYGPDPGPCIDLLQQYSHICVAGNHDLAAIGKISAADFNPEAAAACHWTTRQMKKTHIRYLEGLPQVIPRQDFTLVHGSPREPIREYLLSVSIARENFAFFSTPYCLVGHSHVPLVFKQTADDDCSLGQLSSNIFGLSLGENRMIINPGGVGQPRDGDPRASYAIYDSQAQAIRPYRVTYDIAATQDKMVALGLPMRLAVRLSYGL